MSADGMLDMAPLRRPQELVTEAEYRAWVLAGAGELPWDADPLGMPAVAQVGGDGLPVLVDAGGAAAGIVFGAAEAPEAEKVCNWVLVDDLGGLGELWCGSYAGRFYLTCTRPASVLQGVEEEAIAAGASGEVLGMALVAEVGSVGAEKTALNEPLMPRQACPMSARESLLQVDGKWRSDLPWDTLINGPLCYMPPIEGLHNYTPPWSSREGCGYSTPLRFLTLRMVQVGRWLCFHTQISEVEAVALYEYWGFSGFEFHSGGRYSIGHSAFDGAPFDSTEGGANSISHPWHGWTAEPPWGSDRADSWAGEESATLVGPAVSSGAEASGVPGAATDGTGLPGSNRSSTHTRCRVYPRLHIGEGHFSPYINACIAGEARPHTTAAEVEQAAESLLSTHWHGGSPDWMEDFLGIGIPEHWEARQEPYTEPELTLGAYSNLRPQAAPTKVFSAHLPLADGGHVHLALWAATIDNTLLTASACCPYNYWSTTASP